MHFCCKLFLQCHVLHTLYQITFYTEETRDTKNQELIEYVRYIMAFRMKTSFNEKTCRGCCPRPPPHCFLMTRPEPMARLRASSLRVDKLARKVNTFTLSRNGVVQRQNCICVWPLSTAVKLNAELLRTIGELVPHTHTK